MKLYRTLRLSGPQGSLTDLRRHLKESCPWPNRDELQDGLPQGERDYLVVAWQSRVRTAQLSG